MGLYYVSDLFEQLRVLGCRYGFVVCGFDYLFRVLVFVVLLVIASLFALSYSLRDLLGVCGCVA